MRRLLILAAAGLIAAGCASAVYDSLERRGVDAQSVLADRVADARDDATSAAQKVEAAAAALGAVKGLEGAALARQIDQARAGAQEAVLAAQTLRLSSDTVGASGLRYFGAWEEEIGLYEKPADRSAAEAKLAAQSEAHNRLINALSAASLRLSPALTLLSDEIAVLRKNPTSGVAVSARAARIDAASAASGDAAAALRAAAVEADRFLAALNSPQ